jgi:LemA protein
MQNWTTKTWIVVSILVVFGIYQVMGVAVLATSQQGIRGKTAQVWVDIQRANDLLPRLEQQVNTTIGLQKDLIDKIAAARSANSAGLQGDKSDPNSASNAASATLVALRAFNEAYPDVGLSQIQQDLFDETAGSINRITYARQQLVDAETSYDTARILFFPVGLMFFKDMPILGEDQNPAQTLPPSKVGVSPSPQAIILPNKVGIFSNALVF